MVVIGALLAATAIVIGLDPERPWAVAAFIVALGIAVGAGAIAWQGGRRGRGRGSKARSLAFRRAVEMGAAVTLLLWLRAVDGLSVITASFVIATIIVGEAVLSARPQSQR